MSKTPKMTPWFPPNVKPARQGIYELLVDGGAWFSHFDGEHWNGAWSTPDRAQAERRWFAFDGHEGYASARSNWRGLAADPGAKP